MTTSQKVNLEDAGMGPSVGEGDEDMDRGYQAADDPFLRQPIGEEGADHSHAGEEDLVGEMEDNIFDHWIPSS